MVDAWVDWWGIAKLRIPRYPTIMSDELPPNLGRRVGNLDDLPEKLRAQLQVGKMGDLERAIVALIREDYEGVANVDEVLVGLFRRTGEIYDRQPLANRLYRMGQAGHLISVPKRKGVYRTK